MNVMVNTTEQAISNRIAGPERHRKSVFASLLLAAVMLLLLSTFTIALNVPNPPMFAASSAWAMFLTGMTFLIFRSGRVSRYRSLFFVIYAASFVLVFVPHLMETRGSMVLTQAMIEARNVPLCPVAIPQLILPAVFKRTLIFPTKLLGGPYGGFYAILSLWLVSVLALGRGFCSFGCFYGGLDEGFSKLHRGKPSMGGRFNWNWRYFPFALLLAVAVTSFMSMSPEYCSWLCPLKTVTEYAEVNSPVRAVQLVIFIVLGAGLLMVLPALTGKRIQCGLFCPLGALQSLLSPLNPYRVRIRQDACIQCGRCKTACPTLSITGESLEKHQVTATCTRCGACMDACPTGAIDYSLPGVGFATCDRVLTRGLMGEEPGMWRRIVLSPLRLLEDLLDARTLPDVRLVGEACDGQDAVKLIDELRPQIVFLDIHLPGLNGFDVLSRAEHGPMVVFVTAYDRYAIRAFEERAVDYVLKPFSKGRIREAVDRVSERRGGLGPDVLASLVEALSKDRFLRRFSVKEGEHIVLVAESRVVLFRASDKRVYLRTDSAEYPTDFTLKELEARLDPKRFLRIHKGYIVAVDRVLRVTRWFRDHYVVELDDKGGTKLAVGRSHLAAFRKTFEL
jgi:DNA-binding LytR/AlgR family response regulator/ferredoxin